MNDHGYICKRCHGPAPVGVGYVAHGGDAAQASAGLTRCECGYSVDPRTMTNADAAGCAACTPSAAVREQLQAAGEPAPHTATATREGVQGWRPGCTCGWAHPWHFPSRAAALVAAQSVAAAHRIESGAES